MTMSPDNKWFRRAGALLAGALALACSLPVLALQATLPSPPPMVLVPPPPAVQFQQSVRQQQVRDQLQKSQLESDLRRGVSEQAMRPLQDASRNRIQLEQAAQAQRERDQAAQQDLINQYWGVEVTQPPSRVQPAKARSGH